ncbi:hypothetical protein [Nostoc sp. C052]|nr:hypothetical protein [Nostoc sp. C052]
MSIPPQLLSPLSLKVGVDGALIRVGVVNLRRLLTSAGLHPPP